MIADCGRTEKYLKTEACEKYLKTKCILKLKLQVKVARAHTCFPRAFEMTCQSSRFEITNNNMFQGNANVLDMSSTRQ